MYLGRFRHHIGCILVAILCYQVVECCSYPYLPQSLDSYAYLGTEGQFHTAGTYQANFSMGNEFTSFTLSSISALRVYVAPHDIDVSLYLYSGSQLVAQSVNGNRTEEILFGTFPEGHYSLNWSYNGYSEQNEGQCSSLFVEMAIMPTSVLSFTANAYPCNEFPIYPSPTLFTNLSEQGVNKHYSDSYQSIPELLTTQVIESLPITIPEVEDAFWKVKMALGFDFLTGGSLGMAITPTDWIWTNNVDCTASSACTISTGTSLNQREISVTLYPGNYQLIIYDSSNHEDSLTTCTPFAFGSMITMEFPTETYITCTEIRLPNTFNQPGFLSSDGFLYWSGQVFQSQGAELDKITFTVYGDSFAKFLVQSSQVQLELTLEFEGYVIASAVGTSFRTETSIVMELQRGSYILTVSRITSYELSPCQTYSATFEITPQSAIQVQCPNEPYNPNWNSMRDSLNQYPFIYDEEPNPGYPYVFVYPSENSKGTLNLIVEEQFEIHQASQLYLEIGLNMIVGDMSAVLSDSSNNTVESIHAGGTLFLFSELESDTYNLQVTSGPTQSGDISLPNFPDCILYTVKLTVLPIENIKGCFQYVMLPETLVSPSFLSTSEFVSIHNTFQQPDIKKSISLTVVEESFLKVHISQYNGENMAISLDISGEPVTTSLPIEYQSGQQLEYLLEPSIEYELVIISNIPQDLECHPFKLDLEIHPTSNFEDSPCTIDSPTADDLQFTILPSLSQIIYGFNTVSGMDYTLQVPFTIPEQVKIRMSIIQNFMQGNITAQLESLDNQQAIISTDSDFAYGVAEPGDYILHIMRPQSLIQQQWTATCVEYQLLIAYDPMNMNSITQPIDCLTAITPPTLNTLIYLSEFTAEQTHFQREMLLPSTDSSYVTYFTLSEPSIFHCFIGYKDGLEVELQLYNENTSHVWYGDTELQDISVYLPNGEYHLSIIFQLDDYLSNSYCENIPLEMQLMTESYIDGLNIPSSCQVQDPPNFIFSTFEKGIYQYTKYLNVVHFHKEVGLSLDPGATHVYIELEYNFLLGQMGMTLKSYIGNSSEASLVIQPEYMQNGAFIDVDILVQGDIRYVIELSDYSPVQDEIQNSICISYAFTVVINDAVNPACDITEPLPTDLYSDNGGSLLYGGPQDNESSRVRIVGRKFPVLESGEIHTISFYSKVDSVLRVYLDAKDSDIILSVSKSDGTSIDAASSNLWGLDAQETTFILQIEFVTSPPNIYCSFFELQLEIKPTEQVMEEVSCPIVMPYPMIPDSILYLEEDTVMYGSFLFNDTFLLDPFNHQEFHGKDEFYYRITLVPQISGSLHAFIEYDFISSDFTLELSNAMINQVVNSGKYASTINAGNHDFRYVLNSDIDENISYYYLDIIWNSVDLHPFNLEEYCVEFDLTITFTSSTEPHLMFIDPPQASNINPVTNFIVTFVFSESVSNPTADGIIDQNLISITEYLSSTKIYPFSIEFTTDNTLLICIFSSDDIVWGVTYTLEANLEDFLTKDNQPFESNILENQNVYSFQDCDCGNNGICSMVANQFVCECNLGYSGDFCTNCATGYHGVGLECMIDQVCESDTCNGHGECSQSHAWIACDCDLGWATLGDEFCSICANGYYKQDEECLPTPDGTSRSTACYDPLLPSTLNSVSLLSYNGKLHLIDEYFIDLQHSGHNITFTLEYESICSIVIGNDGSSINADVAIYSKNNILLYSSESTIFGKMIYETIPYGEYYISFTYLPQEESSFTDGCTSIPIEIVIESIEELINASACQNPNSVPSSIETKGVPINSEYSFEENTFSIIPDSEEYFYSVEVEINSLPDDTHGLITVNLGYQAITGYFGVMVELGSEANKCNDDISRCTFAHHTKNKQFLQAKIVEGAFYTIWFYHKGSYPLEACTDYTLSYSIEYVPDKENEWNCNGIRLPKNLSIPTLMNSDGYLHIADHFFLPESTEVELTIEVESIVRFSESSSKSTTFYYMTENDTDWISIPSTNSAFTTTLSNGTYQIRIDSWIGTISSVLDNEFCELSSIEIAVQPIPESVPCSYPYTSLPTMYSDLITPPFSFGIPTEHVPAMTFTKYLNSSSETELIYQTYFELTDPAQVFIGVSSDFLFHNLVVSVEGSDIILNGRNYYNYNYLDQVLPADSYTITITRSGSFNLDDHVLECVRFNFQMKMSDITECASSGEPLPETLISVRFLQEHDTINYYSPSARVPDRFLEDHYAESIIPLQVETLSIFRFHVSPPLGIGVNIILQKWDINNNVYLNVSSPLHYDITEPNSLEYLLESGDWYQILMIYTLEAARIQKCPTFQYHISVTPYQQPEIVCPNGGSDHFPPTLESYPVLPYYYDSYQENIYFEQSYGHTISFSDSFHLVSPSNIHAQISFDFIYLDLQLILENKDTGEIIYASRTFNGEVLHLTNLQAGSYKLKTKEPVTPIDETVGCVHYSYQISIEEYSYSLISQESDLYPSLPDNLNLTPYLAFDQSCCLSNVYMFESDTQEIYFNLEHETIVRVTFESDSLLGFLFYQNGNYFYSYTGNSSFIINLEAGNGYSIVVSNSNIFDQYYIQLCMEPTGIVNGDMQIWNEILSPCDTTLWESEIDFYSGTDPYSIQHDSNTISSGVTGELTSTQITTSGRVYLYASIGFQFIPNQLELSLRNSQGDELTSGYTRYNSVEIFIELPEGEYSLVLIKPYANDVLEEYCTSYSLSLVLSDSGTRRDCLSVSNLPDDLRNVGDIYGGPIDENGYISFYGPSFLLSEFSVHSSSIQFTITNSSVISIITDTHGTSANSGVGIDLFEIINGIPSVIPALYSIHSDSGVNQNIYDIEDSEAIYSIVLYDGTTDLNLVCPSFSLGIEMSEKWAVVEKDGSCPDVMNSPSDDIGVVDGFGHQWFESSVVEQVSGAIFEITFEVEETSQIQAILGYQNLLSIASLSLIDSDSDVNLMYGSYSMQQQSIHTNEALSLYRYVEPGEYKLQYSLTTIAIDTEISCIPFTWYTQVFPSTASTFISSVIPATRTDVGISETLVIQITFSSSVFSNTMLVNSENTYPVLNAITLQPTYSTNIVYPNSVFNIDSFGLTWVVTFESENLLPGESYLLQLENDILFDADNEPVYMFSQNIYSILPECSLHEIFNSQIHECECLPNYTGVDCSACSDGFLHYPLCTPVDNCNPTCIHGECYDVVCTCAPHWDGEDCSYCKFPFDGGDCNSCSPPFAGTLCEDCIPPFTGNNCTECISPYTGIDCSACISPFTGSDCTECIPPFTGIGCNECIAPFTGNNCDECIPPFDGGDCTSCIYPFTGKNCDQCISPFTGDNCGECIFPYTGDNCLDCVEPFTGPTCGDCQYPFTGVWCTDCLDNFVGNNCDYCALGFSDPSSNCTNCAPHWNEDCSACDINWDGPTCGYCSEHFEGNNCENCATNWDGENCDICPLRFQESPGNCGSCALNFQGETCSECADGFTGTNCTELESDSFETGYAVDPFIYEVIIAVIVFIIFVSCVIVILVMLIVKRKRISKAKKFVPVLDLDEEDAVELESNPILGFGEPDNSLMNDSEFHASWDDHTVNLNVGGILDLDVDDEFEGALDLDDFDTL